MIGQSEKRRQLRLETSKPMRTHDIVVIDVETSCEPVRESDELASRGLAYGGR